MGWGTVALIAAGVIAALVLFVAINYGRRILWTVWTARKTVTATKAALALLGGAAYTVSPIDAIPDVIFGLGWLDDAIVWVMIAMYLRQFWLSRRSRTSAVNG